MITQVSTTGINTAMPKLIMLIYFKLCQQGVDFNSGNRLRQHFIPFLCKCLKCHAANVGKGLLMATAPLCQSSSLVFNVDHDF